MSQLKQLVDVSNSLIALTQDAKIKWTETAEEDSFRAILSKGLVRVERHEDPYARAGEGAVPVTTGLPFTVPPGFKSFGEFIYSIVFVNDNNRELVRYLPISQEQAAVMKNLWEKAAQSARDSGSKLDDLLNEIAGKVNKALK